MSKKRASSLSDILGGPSDETRHHANTTNAKWGSKDNFFSGGRSIWSKIRPTHGGKRRSSQAAVIPGYADGRDKGGIPAIGAGGARTRKDRQRVPQIAATATAPGTRQIPNIAGSGGADRSAPAIGSGQVTVEGRGREATAPNIGGYSAAAGNSPDAGAGKRFHRARSIAAHFGFRPLNKDEEQEMDLFLRRAHQAGHEVPYRQWMSWRASIMLDEITVMDLWNGPIGQDIQRRYGAFGQALDVPESKRTGGQVVPEPEESKVDGVSPSTQSQPVEAPR